MTWVIVDSHEAPGSGNSQRVATPPPAKPKPYKQHTESVPDRIRRVTKDMEQLKAFHIISIAPRAYESITSYLDEENKALQSLDFDALNQDDKADYLLLQAFFKRQRRTLDLEHDLKPIVPALPFANYIITASERREDTRSLKAELMAESFSTVEKLIYAIKEKVENGEVTMSIPDGYRVLKVLDEFKAALRRIDEFYAGYKPMYDWWMRVPFDAVMVALDAYIPVVKAKLAGQHPDKKDEIVGRALGRENLLVELEAEMIAYTPEALIRLAQDQYKWAEREMKKAAKDLGYGEDWKQALEHTKKDCVPPGEQDEYVDQLARHAENYVQDNDLVTVPPLVRATTRRQMMTPEEQMVTPFLSSGWITRISYPTASMPSDKQKMVMRGNSRGLTHAVVFHEEIPGHRLQVFNAERHNSHRWLFITPFIIEGWGMYWEMNLWNRGDYFNKPVDKIGTLFWRMHRCARIIFTLQFHLGQKTPQEMVDGLVSWVGHERSTAEGEVRRWINGEWPPLYQCGYMLGALQLIALQKEALESGKFETEREFNDQVLRSCFMPIELMRALVLEKKLTPDYEPSWKFYGNV